MVKRAKRSLALMFNGIVTVHYGEEIPLLDGEVRICPEAGVFKKSIIRRELLDGSFSTTEWNGELSVKVGDYVLMDLETGQIFTKRDTAKPRRKSQQVLKAVDTIVEHKCLYPKIDCEQRDNKWCTDRDSGYACLLKRLGELGVELNGEVSSKCKRQFK